MILRNLVTPTAVFFISRDKDAVNLRVVSANWMMGTATCSNIVLSVADADELANALKPTEED